MPQVQQPFSMHSTLGSDHRSSNNNLPSIPQLHDFYYNQLSHSPRAGNVNFGQHLRSELAVSHHGLHTPPGDMTGRNSYPSSQSPHVDGHLNGFRSSGTSTQWYPTPQHTAGSQGRLETKPEPFYNSYYSARQNQSPNPRRDSIAFREQPVSRRGSDDRNAIVSYLQIPSSINDSKGSLPEFAAQITCLFWFETSHTLTVAEGRRLQLATSPLAPEAQPTMGFRKWVTTILSMTQVSQNVILLALMFIYRLKKLNPGVKGKVGSEFRLLTVALMLGNKFLDDNTYTNKTWAEVSGISVQEIHVMEVEFLSNMRYTLYASATEWDEWHVKLGEFADYFDKANQLRTELPPRNVALPNPAYTNLPSPPVSHPNASPFQSKLSPPKGHTLPHPLSMPPYIPPTVASPAADIPQVDVKPWSRKRSLEDHCIDLPSKRMSFYGNSANSSSTLTPSTLRDTSSPAPRLPMPNLSISTGHHYSGPEPNSAQLPTPSGRAMATVFPNPNRPQPLGALPSLHPPQYSSHHESINSGPPMPNQPQRSSHVLRSSTPSPTSRNFPSHQGTPNGLSPSGLPIPRNSPYKPIRRVNTLLVPPPSTSLQKPQHPGSYDQLHWQSLGKSNNEQRTGVLPYLHFQTWSEAPRMPHLPQPLISS